MVPLWCKGDGVFVPEMIRPLTFLFTNPKYTEENRDEALIYLAMIDVPQVSQVLVLAADLILKNNNPENDYYPSRGLFGLLLLDDINVLAEQMLKNPPDHFMLTDSQVAVTLGVEFYWKI